jgi:DDE family transposase
MTATLTRLVAILQQLFFDAADAAADGAHLIERQRQLSPPAFAQGLVFAWMQHPDASTSQLASFVTAAGAPISGPGLCQRFNEAASDFLLALLQSALQVALAAPAAAAALLGRFGGVYLLDGTHFVLPACLAQLWPSTGGDNGNAGIKGMALLEFCSGQFNLQLKPARDSDTTFAAARQPLPRGALRLADLGFFDLDVLLGYHLDGVFYITRAQPHTTLCVAGRCLPLWEYLRDCDESRLEQRVALGQDGRLPCRLLAWRCPPEVVARRRQKARVQASRHGRALSKRVWVMCAWTVLFTNVPAQKATADEVWVLYRVRWQVELLFKRWKSLARVGHSVGRKVQRVLCEVYAKLLGVVVRSWLLLLAAGGWPRRSAWKCFVEVGSWGRTLMLALGHSGAMLRLLWLLREVLAKVDPVAARQKKPATFQTLMYPQDNGPQAAPPDPAANSTTPDSLT